MLVRKCINYITRILGKKSCSEMGSCSRSGLEKERYGNSQVQTQVPERARTPSSSSPRKGFHYSLTREGNLEILTAFCDEEVLSRLYISREPCSYCGSEGTLYWGRSEEDVACEGTTSDAEARDALRKKLQQALKK